ncbi:hypothetical protein A4G99_21170 [Haladaptatus sp. R4]|uniref:hypothetical protein n=1 Tax=Haladaptatus sp. R4 TaxID=1679489 RepID=UPI0007B4749D|nr:hypothetical protein [Haladaptatus sp. R4]KZN26324.1 hypothetical protein A4G99_21170 [Haladaptatus sp. R4]
MPETDQVIGPDIEVSVFLTTEAKDYLGTHPQAVAAAYLRQALDYTSYDYAVYEPSNTYTVPSSDSQDSIDLGDFASWCSNQTYGVKDSNLLVTYSSSHSGAASDSYSYEVAYDASGIDLNKTDTSTELTLQNTVDGSGAISGCLHEVGHNLIDNSLTGTESHKTGSNNINSSGEYHVTPMLSGYDRQFYGSYNYCGTDYIENPANNTSGIYYDFTWAECMKNNIVPK